MPRRHFAAPPTAPIIALGVFCLVIPTTPLVSAEVPPAALAQYKNRLKSLLSEKREQDVGLFIREMADLDHPDTVELIFPALSFLPSAENFDLAVEALAMSKSEEVRDQLFEIVRERGGKVIPKVVAVESFGRRTDGESVALIREAMEIKDVQVQLAAVRATLTRRSKELVSPLIALLASVEKKRDRVWLEATDALSRLSGEDFADASEWEKWWDLHQASFDPMLQREVKPAREGRTAVGEVPSFFGREIRSRRVIFVIDTSASMLMYEEPEGYQGVNPERDLQRLFLAQKALVSALRSLPEDASFNVIAYNDAVMPWQKGLRRATSSNVKSAERFVGTFRATGGTSTDDAIAKAFEDEDVDAIVLLSDGAPTKKGFTNSLVLIEKTLQWVKNHNRVRRIRIDTFGFSGAAKWPAVIPELRGREPPPPPSQAEMATFLGFLSTLSELSGGIHQTLDPAPGAN